MKNKPQICIVEDEEPIRRFIRSSLPLDLYEIVEASSGGEALAALNTQALSLILLDLGLPDVDGVELTKLVRQKSMLPIIVLSARGEESDKVSALDAGADDYLTKPFGVEELLARIRVALRHRNEHASFRSGGLEVDL